MRPQEKKINPQKFKVGYSVPPSFLSWTEPCVMMLGVRETRQMLECIIVVMATVNSVLLFLYSLHDNGGFVGRRQTNSFIIMSTTAAHRCPINGTMGRWDVTLARVWCHRFGAHGRPFWNAAATPHTSGFTFIRIFDTHPPCPVRSVVPMFWCLVHHKSLHTVNDQIVIHN